MRKQQPTYFTILQYLLWPSILMLGITIYWLGTQSNTPVLAYNIAYFTTAILLFLLERYLPYESQWLKSDGQAWNDVAHTALTKGASQLIATSAVLIGVSQHAPETASSIWPTHWPLALQVALGLVVAEFGLYWAHRLAHEWWPVWCWHAVHHSATKLWFVNTGRFHLFDSLWKSSFALLLAMLVGAPKPIVMWVLVITPLIGFMTHCNVDMRCGWLNWVFNTPQLHRWHHSKAVEEGNSNYGENLIIWDIVFGTRYYPNHRRPPVDIGCPDNVPKTWLGQLAYPVKAWFGSDA